MAAPNSNESPWRFKSCLAIFLPSFLLVSMFKFRDPDSPVRVSFAKDLVRVKIGAHHDPGFWRNGNMKVGCPLKSRTFPRLGCYYAWRHPCC